MSGGFKHGITYRQTTSALLGWRIGGLDAENVLLV